MPSPPSPASSHRPGALVLGVESSCDDTACAILDEAGSVLSSVVSSQMAAHRPYGGVVPEIASREHLRNWPSVSGEALQRAGCDLADIGAVAATYGPGLVGALLVGLSLGKALAYGLGVPFYAVHHLEGHLYSPFLRERGEPALEPPERFAALVVSGGHTALYRVAGTEVETLAETRDDALGEAFDKFGKRLGLPFPGGPHVDAWAERAEADPELAGPATGPASRLRVARCRGALDFSYSGLKTQAVRAAAELERELGPIVLPLAGATAAPGPDRRILELVVAFRRTAVAQVLDRLERLYRSEPFATLAVSGGAAANRLLRRRIERWSVERGVALYLVPLTYSGDNAAMIAHAALLRHRRGEMDDPLRVEAISRLPLGARAG